jgi:hypothetical protein
VPRPAWMSRANCSGAPISREMASPASFRRLLYSARIARKRSSRSLRVVRAKAGKAARAAATARSTSAALPMAIWMNASSVDGSMTSRKAGFTGSTHLPSM